LLTFHYVCVAWIFFRAPSFERAREIFAQIGTLTTDSANLSTVTTFALSLAVAAHILPPGTFRWLRDGFVLLPPWGRAAVLASAALLLRQLAQPGVVPFIYFQF